MRIDLYGPDRFGQQVTCKHGKVTATRSDYGVWTFSPCALCEGVVWSFR